MEKQLLKSTAQRLHVQNPAVILKAEEFLRLYQSKPTIKTLDDQAKLVMCLDLAATACGASFDKEAAKTLSGFKSTQYIKHRNLLEKILDLTEPLTVADVCIKLGCTSVKETAENYYRRLNQDGHPQWVAVSVYHACKSKNVSIDKRELIIMSQLRSAQFKELTKSVGDQLKPEHRQRHESKHVDQNDAVDEQSQEKLVQKQHENESYQDWRKRMLDEAYAAIKRQPNNSDE